MKRRALLYSLVGSVIAPRLFGFQTGEDDSKNASKFENERIRAKRIRKQPGEHVPMHYVSPSLMVFLSDSASRFTDSVGKTWEETAKAGEIRWWPGGWVRVEILSSREVEFIMVEPL
jgi:hypothetical protein